MAKESSKAPETAAAAQTPDVRPAVPGSAPVRAIPPVPLKARAVDPKTEVVYRNMRGATLAVEEPAKGTLSAIATRRWGELSVELGFGTARPPVARVGLDDSKQFLYLTPTTKEDPKALEVRYEKSGMSINLMKAFGPSDRYVEPNRREIYSLEISRGKVVFDDGYESVCLYAYLVPEKEEPVGKMSEESKAKLRATLARKKQAKQEQALREQAAADQGPGEEQE